jgi:hypothetical protein
MTLVETLDSIRLEKGLNDTQFAKVLGVHKDLWSKTKLGKVAVGWSVCTGALREYGEDYPELKRLVTDYMAGVGTRREGAVAESEAGMTKQPTAAGA